MSISVIYYTVGKRNPKLLNGVLERLYKQQDRIIIVGPQSVPAPTERMAGLQKGKALWNRCVIENIYVRILVGLQSVKDSDTVYLAEDDVLYPDEHFTLYEKCKVDTFNYNYNMVHLTPRGYCVVHQRASLALSMAFARADIMRNAVIHKLEELRTRRFRCYEPTESDGYQTDHADSKVACIDIRDGGGTTWTVDGSVECYEDEPGWPPASRMMEQYGIGAV